MASCNLFQEIDALLDGDWASTDSIKIALVTSATAPTDATATPALGDFTECTIGGNYSEANKVLGTWANVVTRSGAVTTIDDPDATWSISQHASNPTDARYAVVYNDTQTGDPCFIWIDLDSIRDLTTGDFTITWHANGMASLTVP